MNPQQINKLMLEDLARSKLTAADAKKMQLNVKPHALVPKAAAYTLRYFDTNGRPTKFYRIRYVEDTRSGFKKLTGQKPLRYNQPAGSMNEVYLPPFIKWSTYLKGNEPLVITEGEKKSAIATKEGLPTIGLGGVWSFMSKRNGLTLLPVLEETNWKDRPVYICYDSDASSNPDIMKAEAVLATRLTAKGAIVYICRIPHAKDHKVGIDDYLATHSMNKFMRNVLHKAYQHEENKGMHDLNTYLVYIKSLNMVYDSNQDLMKSPHIFTTASHCNLWIDVPGFDAKGNPKITRKQAAKLWLEWPHRAELQGITYAPGQPPITDANERNMWKGWGVDDAVKGNVQPWKQLLDHLFEGSEPEGRVWFERWCAYPIQHPGVKMATAAVMWGVSQGTGKTLLGHTLMKLYGDNATEVKDSDLENGRFAWAENKQFALADDITGQNNRKLANLFKTMVTQLVLHINKKYVPDYSIPDTINYYFTSNDPDAFFLDDADRRFFINEVKNNVLPQELLVRYRDWMHSKEGIQALFYHLLNLDLGDFDPQAKAPLTEAKREMNYITKSELGVFVDELKNDPDQPLNGKMRGDLFTASELHLLFDPMGTKRASTNALSRELKRAGIPRLTSPGGGALKVGDKQLRLYAVRNPEKWIKAQPKDIADHLAKHASFAKTEKKDKF